MDIEQENLGVVAPEISTEQEAPIVVDRIAGEPDLVPEKFKGKTIDDVFTSYKSLESEYSKTKSKIGELESKAQEAERLKQELEFAQRQQALLQQQNQLFMSQGPAQTAPQKDRFNELWEHDPANAVKQAIYSVQQNIEQKLNQRETVSHYQRLKQSLPDFTELEPVMEQVSQQLAPFIDPSVRSSPVVLDTMYYIAKGIKADETAKKAVNKGMEEARKVQAEKNAAISEGPSSHMPAKDFSSMSTEEMRQYLIDSKIAQPGF